MPTPNQEIQAQAQAEARKRARASEFGLGNRSAFFRAISHKVDFTILPGTRIAEACLKAFADEKRVITNEQQAFRALEHALERAYERSGKWL